MLDENLSYKNPNILENLYWKERLTLRQIAEKFGTTDRTILYWMMKNKISRRPTWSVTEKYKISKDTLENLYLNKKLSASQIAMKFGTVNTNILRKLLKYGIPIRTKSEAMIKFPKKSFSNSFKEKAYMTGLRCGDINARKNSNHVRIQTCSTHLSQIRMIKDVFEKYSEVRLSIHTNKIGKEWAIYCDLDSSFNFLIEKPLRIPKWIIEDDNLFFLFLAGYMDSEGSWVITKSNENDIRFIFRIRTYDKVILKQIKEKLDKLNIKSYFYIDKKKGDYTTFGKLKKDFYGVRIYRINDILKLIKMLLPLSHHKEKILKMNFILENKNKKWEEIKDSLLNLRKIIRNEVVKL